MRSIARFASNRPRLTSAICFGIGISLLLPNTLSAITRALIAWNIGVWIYLVLMTWLMTKANHAQVCKIAQQEDKSAIAVLFILSVAALASIAVIIVELASIKGLSIEIRLGHYLFTGITIFGSWCLIGVIYTIHYARLFYTCPTTQPALAFPDKEKNPNYWDFLYFSFSIAVATQTSDVNVMNQAARKTVLAQSILSFLFNVTIVGLSINIVAGLLNP